MRIKPNGDFLVRAGEIIAVTVLASDTVYLAAFSHLSVANWIMVSPPNPEVRKFSMPAVAINSFDVAFAFQPAADPAKYHVTIVGDPAGDTYEEDIPPDPPLPTGRDYRFVTN